MMTIVKFLGLTIVFTVLLIMLLIFLSLIALRVLDWFEDKVYEFF